MGANDCVLILLLRSEKNKSMCSPQGWVWNWLPHPYIRRSYCLASVCVGLELASPPIHIMEHRPGVKRPDAKPPVVNSLSGVHAYAASYAVAQQE